MMKMVWIYIFLILLCCEINKSSFCSRPGSDCGSTHLGIPLEYFASITPYRFNSNPDVTVQDFPGCSGKRVWMLIRHGTRFPKETFIKRMKEELPVLRDKILWNWKRDRGYLCKDEIKPLERWNPFVKESEECSLTHEGEDEMVDLAERFQQRFPRLFKHEYSNTSYQFRHSSTAMTRQSAHYFTEGLFGRRVSNYVWFPEPGSPDPVLMFYKFCPKWESDVNSNPEAWQEQQKFKSSPRVKVMMYDITNRLGMNETLTLDEIYLMYETCAYETAWDKRVPSPWCGVFIEPDFKVLAYMRDLEYYWIDGYGFNITYQQACPILKDWIQLFITDDASSCGCLSRPTSVVNFVHSGTLLKFLTRLGLYKDSSSLKHDNFNMYGDSRKWKVSKINSFGSNIVFILYECQNDKKVLTLHQEKMITLPGCPEDDLCSLEHIIDLYRNSLDACDLQEMCSLDTKQQDDYYNEIV